MIKKADIGAGILAGGKNSRVHGRNKSFINIEGTPIIERTILLFEGVFDEIILITNSPNDYKEYARRVVIAEDEIKNAGPLGGIHAGLSKTSKKAVFFTACDMPFLHNGFIQQQLEHFKIKDCNALVPSIRGFTEPLHAIYKKNLTDDIGCFVKDNSNYSIRSFLKTINVCYWDLEDTFFHRNIFRNINTEEDVRAIQGLPR